MVDPHQTHVVIGSEFPEDRGELYIIEQLNEVKLAMATGRTVVLMNCDNMYEALYDVLNQRYLLKKVWCLIFCLPEFLCDIFFFFF